MKIYVKLMQSTLCLTFQTAFKTQCIVKKKKTLIIFIIFDTNE